jgi:hypothetical protein
MLIYQTVKAYTPVANRRNRRANGLKRRQGCDKALHALNAGQLQKCADEAEIRQKQVGRMKTRLPESRFANERTALNKTVGTG